MDTLDLLYTIFAIGIAIGVAKITIFNWMTESKKSHILMANLLKSISSELKEVSAELKRVRRTGEEAQKRFLDTLEKFAFTKRS